MQQFVMNMNQDLLLPHWIGDLQITAANEPRISSIRQIAEGMSIPRNFHLQQHDHISGTHDLPCFIVDTFPVPSPCSQLLSLPSADPANQLMSLRIRFFFAMCSEQSILIIASLHLVVIGIPSSCVGTMSFSNNAEIEIPARVICRLRCFARFKNRYF